jgi:glycosyltransferase involved in cell wall biosynthesis
LAAYPSQWAAASARDHYGVPDERIRVVAYGANFDDVPSRAEATSQRSRDVCHLLFVATDWDRKGGDVAYQAMRALRDGGVDAELTVVGCNPPRSTSDPHLRVYGRLDKQVDADCRRLSQLYLKSHFLLVPTRADCFGMVFAEASAHGTPSIAADTGGVSGAVASGENGFLLPPGSEPAAYAALIANLFTDHARYQALVRSSRTMFEEHLNWDAWGRRMSEYIAALSPQRTGSSLTSVPRVDAMTASPIA